MLLTPQPIKKALVEKFGRPQGVTAVLRPLRGRWQCCSGNAAGAPDVVLTREKGKNGPLEAELRRQGLHTLELPMVETAAGPDRERLPTVLQEQQFGWVTITSPEAAAVFLEGWKAAGQPQVRIAVVGSGTGRILAAADPNMQPEFVPSKANAVHLAAELPLEEHNASVLYPSSAKAGTDLQEGLRQRGFQVTRLNTYDTLPVAELDPEALAQAKKARVVAIASPSAIKAWVKFVGEQHAASVATACIGSTSASAAAKLGLKNVFYAEKPGLDGFATSILDALNFE